MEGKVSIVAFVRAEQAQSKEALDALAKTVAEVKEAQAVVVLSGQQADQQAKDLVSAKCPFRWWRIRTSRPAGRWACTCADNGDREERWRTGGASGGTAFVLCLGSEEFYVEFAQGKMDGQALDGKLNNHNVVGDDASAASKRRLQVANRLLENGEVDKAAEEIEAGLKLAPGDGALLVARAKVLLARGNAKGGAGCFGHGAGWRCAGVAGGPGAGRAPVEPGAVG
jgi:hypothetical protein